jgi:hypothetical protein
MEPLPPSLAAMLENRARRPHKQPAKRGRASLWLWVVVALSTAALTAYLIR